MCIWIPVNLEDLEDHRCIDMYSCQKDLSRFKLTKKTTTQNHCQSETIPSKNTCRVGSL